MLCRSLAKLPHVKLTLKGILVICPLKQNGKLLFHHKLQQLIVNLYHSTVLHIRPQLMLQKQVLMLAQVTMIMKIQILVQAKKNRYLTASLIFHALLNYCYYCYFSLPMLSLSSYLLLISSSSQTMHV